MSVVKQSAGIVWYFILIFVLFVGATVSGTLLYWQMLPWQMGKERETFTNSRQFVDAKREMLLKLVEEHEASEAEIAKYRASDPVKYKDVISGLETQQEAIRARIKTEAKLLPADQVPDSVRKYIR